MKYYMSGLIDSFTTLLCDIEIDKKNSKTMNFARRQDLLHANN